MAIWASGQSSGFRWLRSLYKLESILRSDDSWYDKIEGKVSGRKAPDSAATTIEATL
jgi:hypothetical protein